MVGSRSISENVCIVGTSWCKIVLEIIKKLLGLYQVQGQTTIYKKYLNSEVLSEFLLTFHLSWAAPNDVKKFGEPKISALNF